MKYLMKKGRLNRDFESNVEFWEPITPFIIMPFVSLKYSQVDAILKSVPNFY